MQSPLWSASPRGSPWLPGPRGRQPGRGPTGGPAKMPGRERLQEGFGFQSQAARLPLRLTGEGTLQRPRPPGAAGKASTGRKTLKGQFGSPGVSSLQRGCSEARSGMCHPTPTLPAPAPRHWWVLGLGFLIYEMEPSWLCSASQGHRAELMWGRWPLNVVDTHRSAVKPPLAVVIHPPHGFVSMAGAGLSDSMG